MEFRESAHGVLHPVGLERRRALFAGAALLALPQLGWSQRSDQTPALDVPYVPTPQPVVDKMLEMAKVGSSDVVYDLGCGDGRIVITAAKVHGARGVGVDLNPVRIQEAQANAKSAGVTDKVQLRVANIFETDVSPASVVTLYLLPTINRKLRPQLWRQLRVGTRVVSHAFDMGDEWPPERTEQVDHRTVYYWTIKEEHKKRA
ncbi:class I SAM-dependent methyltransferase [Ramlibacter sp. AW1]|uniref:Class I SAM-dependent methyltransferase n=1 Tax=Ramlibacter aurantiacus TaxID=2801330 RepID=A0A936ZSX1_9BURK|nr:class I SAM-dependent methyltransferase [Ramlibacter aurantiacus]MBL0421961.1 class I SAM-dependent methyltransferase [Ramlibacter aurantiacus]